MVLLWLCCQRSPQHKILHHFQQRFCLKPDSTRREERKGSTNAVHTVLQLWETHLHGFYCFGRVSFNTKRNILPVDTAVELNIRHLPKFIVKIQYFNTLNIQIIKQGHHSVYIFSTTRNELSFFLWICTNNPKSVTNHKKIPVSVEAVTSASLWTLML